MAYNLVMELEVSCNNIGKCPWIGHLSELVSHQNMCDKAIKILEENHKKFVKDISKRFSYGKDKCNENNDNDNGNDSTIFSRTDIKKNKNIKLNKDTENMIQNLNILKQKFLNKTNNKNKKFDNDEQKTKFKQLFL